MGAWRVAVFADDRAVDVRDGFRELVAAGWSSEEAVQRLIAGWYLGELEDGEVAADWIALAVTQWKTGRLLDWVRERALVAMATETEAIWDDPALWRKRRKVLEETGQMLRSPQRAPTKIKRPPMLLSPFAEGDVIRFKMRSGLEVAVWVMANKLHESLTVTEVESEFQLIAFGEPKLPDLATLVAREPVCLTEDDGRRDVYQFVLYLPQTAKEPEWEVIGNSPFPAEHRDGGNAIWRLNERGVDPVERASRLFQSLYEMSLVAPSPEVLASQRLVDAFPGLDGLRQSWTGRPSVKAEHVAVEFSFRLQDDRPAPPTAVFLTIDELLNDGEPAKKIGVGVVGALLNLASHPELTITREDVLSHLQPAAKEVVKTIDDQWCSGKSVERPPDLDNPDRARSVWPKIHVPEFHAWLPMARVRRLENGTYASNVTS
jgi:hypothetical protein